MSGGNNINMRDAVGGVVIAGDGNKVANTATVTQAGDGAITLAMARESFAAIRAVLDRLETAERGKIGRALDDAGEEAAKPEPNKKELGEALQRALTKAKEAGQVVADLEKPVNTIAGWIASAAPSVASGLRALFG